MTSNQHEPSGSPSVDGEKSHEKTGTGASNEAYFGVIRELGGREDKSVLKEFS